MLYYDEKTGIRYVPKHTTGFLQIDEEQLQALSPALRRTEMLLTDGTVMTDYSQNSWVYFQGEVYEIAAHITANGFANFQAAVWQWAVAVLGEEMARDPEERTARVLEECGEFVQSKGMSRAEAHRLIDYVYDRPVGEPGQELAGLLVTAAVAATASDLNMGLEANTELFRIWARAQKIREKQYNKPNLRDSATS